MLKFNHKEQTSAGRIVRQVNKKAVFGLRIFFVAAAFFVLLVIASESPWAVKRSNPVKITHYDNSEIASSSQIPPRNDILKFFAPTANAQGVETANNSGLANNAGLDNISGQVNLPQTDIRIFIVRLINIALSLIGIILVGLVTYGGWLWMTSEGDPQKVNQAKAIFKNATIGLLIILSAFAIVNFILKALWGGGGNGGTTTPQPTYDIGVGALGDGIIESHYPTRGQADVPRNTMIIITFKEVLDPQTVCGAAVCDGATKLLTDNISLFSTTGGGELNEDANDSKDTAKITAAKVESKDNKTFVFRPDKFLGSESAEQWYGVRLFGGKLKKSNGDEVKLGIADYYQWKFQVSTRLDLTPPQVESIFPLPDTKPDTKIIGGNALQTKWTITISGTPVEYKESDAKINPAVSGASLIGAYQNCSGSDTVIFKISTGSVSNKLAVVLDDGGATKGFNGESVIINKTAAIGCGLVINFSDIPEASQIIKINLAAEQAGDKISIDGQDYVFGKEIKTNNNDGIANALNANQLVSAVKSGSLILSQVTLTARPEKLPGAQGNDIEVLVSNPGALTLTKTEGKDKEEGYTTKDQPDQPRNAVIQINFNEAMNPMQLQGDSNSVQNYIKVLNVTAPIEGIFTISNNYKTLEFKTKTECGENTCGEKMYCLPALANIKVWVKAASLITCTGDEECAKTSGNNLNFGVCSGSAATLGICQQKDTSGKMMNYSQASAAMDGAMDAAA
ncbi:MAG: pilin, partial [Patescibacteria group bacterium]